MHWITIISEFVSLACWHYVCMFISIISIGIGFEMHVLVAALRREQCTDIHSLNVQYTIGYF